MLKKTLTICMLMIITLYLPLALTVYWTPWYDINLAFNSHENSTITDAKRVRLASSDLTQFFLHRSELDLSIWNPKEVRHMSDVRSIYDNLFTLFLLGFITLAALIKATKTPIRGVLIKNSAAIALSLPLIFLLLIPFFDYFWTHIFHDALFQNKDWIITPADISYQLFPLQFFINCLIFIVGGSTLLNLILYKKFA